MHDDQVEVKSRPPQGFLLLTSVYLWADLAAFSRVKMKQTANYCVVSCLQRQITIVSF